MALLSRITEGLLYLVHPPDGIVIAAAGNDDGKGTSSFVPSSTLTVSPTLALEWNPKRRLLSECFCNNLRTTYPYIGNGKATAVPGLPQGTVAWMLEIVDWLASSYSPANHSSSSRYEM